MSYRPPEPGEPLTPEETQVAIMMLFGHCAKRTARNLGLGIRVVELCRRELYRKFGAQGAGQLAAMLTGTAERLPASLSPQEDVSG